MTNNVCNTKGSNGTFSSKSALRKCFACPKTRWVLYIFLAIIIIAVVLSIIVIVI